MSRAGKDKRGFSLLELVLVLALIGVSMLVVLPNIAKGLQDRELRASALGLAAAARELRNRALFDGERQQLVVDLAQNSYRIARSHEVRLPAEVRFMSIDGGESVDRDRRRFFFFPNGSGLGGEIVLGGGERALSYLIRFDALTGRVEVERGD